MHWPGHRLAITLFVSIIVIWLAGMAWLMRESALPPEAKGPMLVVFEPGRPEQDIFAAIVMAGAKPVRATAFGLIWVVAGEEEGLAGHLLETRPPSAYAELLISPSLSGCFALADA